MKKSILQCQIGVNAEDFLKTIALRGFHIKTAQIYKKKSQKRLFINSNNDATEYFFEAVLKTLAYLHDDFDVVLFPELLSRPGGQVVVHLDDAQLLDPLHGERSSRSGLIGVVIMLINFICT